MAAFLWQQCVMAHDISAPLHTVTMDEHRCPHQCTTCTQPHDWPAVLPHYEPKKYKPLTVDFTCSADGPCELCEQPGAQQ